MSFSEIFSRPATVAVEAPGRVNLLGEHTDYNDGFVLPTPISRKTWIEAAAIEGNIIEAYASSFQERRSWKISESKFGDWRDYVNGCFFEMQRAGFAIGGAQLHISTNVPLGMGVSSSASLEVAVLRALRKLFATENLDDIQIAKLGQQAEWNFAGVKCGIMDQMAISVGKPGSALFLDTQTLFAENVTLPVGFVPVVIDSGVPRRLAESGYNTRRQECENACAKLGVKSLREVSSKDLAAVERLPSPLRERARHVVTENTRVVRGVEALKRGDVKEFGQLMNASHTSLRDDYAVSVPEVDRLVDITRRHGALGSRITGAGFGGAIVALIASERLSSFQVGVLSEYTQAKFLT